MGKVTTHRLGTDISSDQSNSYALLGLLGSGELSYFLLDQQDKVRTICSHRWDLQDVKSLKEVMSELLQSDKTLFHNYNNVLLALDHNAQTLVPDRLFSADDAQDYLDNVIEWADVLRCKHERIDAIEAENVYAVTTDILEVLKSYLPQASISHLDSSLISASKQLSSMKAGKKLYLNVRGNNLQILYFSDDTLIFNNRFRFQSDRDFLYYTMLVFDQFRLDPEGTPLWLSGGITRDSENFKILYRYIRHLQFMPVPAFLGFTEEIPKEELYQYFDLLSIKFRA